MEGEVGSVIKSVTLACVCRIVTDYVAQYRPKKDLTVLLSRSHAWRDSTIEISRDHVHA